MGKTNKFQNSKLLERTYSKTEDRDVLFTLCYLIHSRNRGTYILKVYFKSIYKIVVCGGRGEWCMFCFGFFFSIYGRKISQGIDEESK